MIIQTNIDSQSRCSREVASVQRAYCSQAVLTVSVGSSRSTSIVRELYLNVIKKANVVNFLNKLQFFNDPLKFAIQFSAELSTFRFNFMAGPPNN